MAQLRANRASLAASQRVTVVGCGHVGLVLAAGLARLGHEVVGLDRNRSVVVDLSQAVLPFVEEGLEDLVEESLSAGRLSFTDSYETAVRDAEVIFLAVDTPPSTDGAPDLSNLRAAVASVAGALHGSHPLVVVKSTVPVGTAMLLEDILATSNGRTATRTRVVANPEFLRQGQAVHDFFNPDRTVIGAHDEKDAAQVAALFAGLPGELVITDVPTAEMIKYASNAFLATRLSFINEIAEICDAVGVDIDGVVEGMGHDRRIGHAFTRPGIGFGGSCLPKDVAGARYVAGVHGVTTPLLAAVQDVNARQPVRAVHRLRAELGELSGTTIAVWGVTFKSGTDDLRESPALEVVRLLSEAGADLRIYEPSGPLPSSVRLPGTIHPDPLQAALGADAVAILSDWSEFAQVDLVRLRNLMRGDVLLDGRNVIDPDRAIEAEFRYVGMGRGTTSTSAVRLLAARSEGAAVVAAQLAEATADQVALSEPDMVPLPWEIATAG